MSNNGNTKTPRTAEDALLCLFVETLSQQNRDLEAGLSMYLTKQGPEDERQRLIARAQAAQQMFRKIKASIAESAVAAR